MKAKRSVSLLIALIWLLGCFTFLSGGIEDTTNFDLWGNRPRGESTNNTDEIQASGLILEFHLILSKKNSTTLTIDGLTHCIPTVVKCGFKELKIQRRPNSSSSWSDYHNYGNDYVDVNSYETVKELTVDPGYQYRAICKHYGKKNILSIQTISNTSNVVAF